MAPASAVGPVVRAALTRLLTRAEVLEFVTSDDGEIRIFDHTPPRPEYPYLRLEAAGSSPENTMGRSDALKYGETVRFRVRMVSQYRGESELWDLSELIMQALNGQRIEVEGYPRRATFEYTKLVPLEDQVGAVVTREWLLEFEALVHQ